MEQDSQLKGSTLLGVGIDSGGTMTKMVYFRPKQPRTLPDYVQHDALPNKLNGLTPDASLDIDCNSGGTLKFIKIPASKNLDFLEFIKSTDLMANHFSKGISITGGGAYKFAQNLEVLGVPVHKINEMVGLVRGLNYLIANDFEIHSEVFSTNDEKPPHVEYPFILANVGSGTSILKITGPDAFERISGSSIGGGTFFGLSALIANTHSYPDILESAKKGDAKNVDMSVGDIYGHNIGKYEHLGLTADLLACSFGKVGVEHKEYEKEDLIASLQKMIAINLGQIVVLNAQIHNVKHVIFAGGFVQNNLFMRKDLDWGVKYWSGGAMQAYFLRHDGYLGALGALLSTASNNDDQINDSQQK